MNHSLLIASMINLAASFLMGFVGYRNGKILERVKRISLENRNLAQANLAFGDRLAGLSKLLGRTRCVFGCPEETDDKV